jgi:hypothetical protein
MAAIQTDVSPLDESAVRSLLESDQLVEARQRSLARRSLSLNTLVLMWGLRIYAVFMFGIVGYQVAHTL